MIFTCLPGRERCVTELQLVVIQELSQLFVVETVSVTAIGLPIYFLILVYGVTVYGYFISGLSDDVVYVISEVLYFLIFSCFIIIFVGHIPLACSIFSNFNNRRFEGNAFYGIRCNCYRHAAFRFGIFEMDSEMVFLIRQPVIHILV